MRSVFTILLCILFSIHQIDAVAQTYAAGACTPVPSSKTCADATPCKTDTSGQTICLTGATVPKGALQVSQTCWQYNYTYDCVNSTNTTDTCSISTWYKPSTCSIANTSCASYITNPDGTMGQCQVYTYTYSCMTQAAQTGLSTTCGTNLNGIEATTTHPTVTNSNAGLAATTMEIANEISTYTNGGKQNAFVGTSESCTKGYFGLKNCCGASPGASSNSTIMNMVVGNGLNVVKYAGQKAIDIASPYVFDAMYSSGLYTNGLNTAITTSQNVMTSTQAIETIYEDGSATQEVVSQAVGTTMASSGFTLGAMGFSYGTGTFAGGWGAIQIGGPALADGTTMLIPMESGFISFNPYVFAAEIAIMIITQLMQCSQQEQLLAMHQGANLSVYTGEYCSNQIPIIGTCIEYTDTYCSFNSLLAKLVNQQGKAQLGLPFNDCSGLTLNQISQIDFSKMDLSQFTAQMTSKAQAALPNTQTLPTPYLQNIMNKATSN